MGFCCLQADDTLGNDDPDVLTLFAHGELRADGHDALVPCENDERPLGVFGDFEERLTALQVDTSFFLAQGHPYPAAGVESDMGSVLQGNGSDTAD